MSRTGLPSARPSEQLTRAGASEDRPPASAFGDGARIDGVDCRTMREVLLDQIDALYRFILVRVGFDEASAEDVLQQTAAAALKADDAPHDIRSAEGWLRGVARNLARRHWREVARRNGSVPAQSEAGERALAALESASPRDVLVERELSQALVRGIASLSSEDQALLYAYYRHARSQSEIAEELGCTPKSVEMKLYRMRARLRDALRECGEH